MHGTVLALLIDRKFQQKNSTADFFKGQNDVLIKYIYSKTYDYILTLLIKVQVWIQTIAHRPANCTGSVGW